MSNDEMKLNCLTDFQRSAILFFTGSNYQVFYNHGKDLLKKLGERELISECGRIEKMIKEDMRREYIADRLLTVGVMASC